MKKLLMESLKLFVELSSFAIGYILGCTLLFYVFGIGKSEKCFICGPQIKQQINIITYNQENAEN